MHRTHAIAKLAATWFFLLAFLSPSARPTTSPLFIGAQVALGGTAPPPGIVYQPPVYGLGNRDIVGLGGRPIPPSVEAPPQEYGLGSIDHGQSASILLHSGQEMLEELDLFIPGRDPMVNLEIRRRHLTGVNLDKSSFGVAWAFNYDQRLLQQPDDSLLLMGYGRQDLFVYVGQVSGTHTWEGAAGRLDTAIWDGVSIPVVAILA